MRDEKYYQLKMSAYDAHRHLVTAKDENQASLDNLQLAIGYLIRGPQNRTGVENLIKLKIKLEEQRDEIALGLAEVFLVDPSLAFNDSLLKNAAQYLGELRELRELKSKAGE